MEQKSSVLGVCEQYEMINVPDCLCGLSRQVDGETRVGVFASRSIQVGEHLTYDYRYVQTIVFQTIFLRILSILTEKGIMNTFFWYGDIVPA